MSDQFIGVKPVEERHRIDAVRLEDFLIVRRATTAPGAKAISRPG